MAISEVNELFLAEVSCHPFRSAPGRSLTDVFFFGMPRSVGNKNAGARSRVVFQISQGLL